VGDGFVILPNAFVDGRLSREAWRETKRFLSPLSAARPGSSIRLTAARSTGSQWVPTGGSKALPTTTTWIDLWRVLHRVRRSALQDREPGEDRIGIMIRPMGL